MSCKARQYSDQMQCPCGLAWDAGDPDPPRCRDVKEQRRREAHVRGIQQLREILNDESERDTTRHHGI